MTDAQTQVLQAVAASNERLADALDTLTERVAEKLAAPMRRRTSREAAALAVYAILEDPSLSRNEIRKRVHCSNATLSRDSIWTRVFQSVGTGGVGPKRGVVTDQGVDGVEVGHD